MENNLQNQELVLLSESLSKFLYNLFIKTRNPILSELLDAQSYIEIYNRLSNDMLEKNNLLSKINSMITDYARMLTFRQGEFSFSFLPKGKEPIYSSDNVWSRKNRQTGKPVRVIQKLLKKEFTNLEYEELNNLLKSEIMSDYLFDIVSGESIRHWYNCDNNESGGTIENSCMRHEECACYLDIYVDHCKMLVLFNSDKTLIKGRAILWEIDGKTYMDRVYYSEDHYLNAFITYAIEHKFYYRENNSLLDNGDDMFWYGPNDDYTTPIKLNLSIDLGMSYYNYPYLDSFRYLDEDNNTLHDCYFPGCAYCSETDGSVTRPVVFTCPACGVEVTCYDGETPWNFNYVDYYDEYYCDDCCQYVHSIGEYVPIKDIVQCCDEDGKIYDTAIWEIDTSEYTYNNGVYYKNSSTESE